MGKKVTRVKKRPAAAKPKTRKKAARSRTPSREKMKRSHVHQQMVEANPDRMSLVDADYIYREVNAAYLASHRCTREQIVGHHVAELLGQEAFEQVIKPHFDLCLSGKQVRYQKWFELPKGREFVDVIYTPFYGPGGKVTGAIVTARDFTEAQVAKEALQFAGDCLDLIGSNVEDVVWVTDPKAGKVMYATAAYERVWGLPLRELYRDSRVWMRAIHSDDLARVERGLERLEKRGRFEAEYRIIRPDGGVRWIRDRGATVYDSKNRARRNVGIAQDITELKKIQSALESERRQVSHNQKMDAIGRLAAGMAHDVNTLLTVILGNAQLLDLQINRKEKVDAAQMSAEIKAIVDAVDRGKAFLEKLLTFGRVRSTKLSSIDLNSVVTQTLDMIKAIVSDNITIDRQLAPDLKRCMGDTMQMQQVVMNLVRNAVDAMPMGGRLKVNTENVVASDEEAGVSGRQAGPYVLLTVSDNGMGMDKRTQDQLFVPYFSTKPVDRGAGLGLSIVYGIVNQAGGFITVESELGKGTTFRIFLPVSASPPADIERVAAAQAPS